MAVMIYTLFKINDIQAMSMIDLLHSGKWDDNLKMFDQAWDFWEILYHRQVETSTRTKNALALYPSDEVHRKEPQSCTQLKALVTNILEDQKQAALRAQKEKSLVKDKAIPVVPSKKDEGDGKERRLQPVDIPRVRLKRCNVCIQA